LKKNVRDLFKGRNREGWGNC